MSGSGKSAVIRELTTRGHRAIDTDWDPEWEAPDPDSDGPGWLWREDRIEQLLAGAGDAALYIGACVENQGRFYSHFDHIVLLSSSEELTRQRLATRTTNPYGRSEQQVEEVLRFKATVEPLLRRSATLEIDTAAPLDDVVDRLVQLVREQP